MVEFLLMVATLYAIAGLGLYVYLVIKTFEALGIWSFQITKNSVGIFEYPYWLMGWLHWLVVKADGFKR